MSCNAHGRGLTLKPIVDQVEAFDLLTASGEVVTCSRHQQPDLFRLAIGGYGLFGLITSVQLRLRPRVKVQRIVTLAETADIMERFDERIRDGYLYGDFQFATDDSRDSFLRRGVFSCYRPVDDATPLTEHPTRFHPDDWARLTRYSHTNKRLAFDFYTSRYLETSGQIYWSDSQLSAAYVDGYHADLDRVDRRARQRLGNDHRDLRRALAVGGIHGGGERDATRAPGQRHLRHGATDRKRR